MPGQSPPQPPQQLIYQQVPPSQCATHATFEKLIENGLANLGDRLQQLAEALTSQSAANGKAIGQVLENQADRRELCGRQNARLDGLEKSDVDQWTAITELRKYMWIGVGIVIAAQVILKFVFKGV